MTEEEIAKMISVTLEQDTGRVLITFEVFDEGYKDTVFRLARRPDIKLILRGDKLNARVDDAKL
jgi:hypothetical protein